MFIAYDTVPDPDHPRAKGNLRYYMEAVKKTGQFKRGDDGDEVPKESRIQVVIKAEPVSEMSEKEIYERLCRGEKVMDVVKEHQLHCRQLTPRSLPIYVLKEEEFSLAPRIVIYHDVLSDSEIEVIQTLAQPKVQ
ncbi:P4HA2 [Cordylochernes scorpioides]|uniref:P4HA2 n=1 Tax=Cordylochernes scorpioides TaxID=51811 RepID=A0ABY6K716_9ARAC|nr:P4HA2 [Cordylochernes scorpioides]